MDFDIPVDFGNTDIAELKSIDDYAYSRGMTFANCGGLPLFSDGRAITNAAEDRIYKEWQHIRQRQWLAQARSSWGNNLFGFHSAYDEPAGRQLDFDRNSIGGNAYNWIGEGRMVGGSY